MNWKEYEKDITEDFKKRFPDARITHNVKLMGRYSKTERQIDILIELYNGGEYIKIVADTKYFNDPLDVKHIEMFIGMLQDIEVEKGILITQKGYSKAAVNRAHYGPDRVELDILNYDEIKNYQGFLGLPFRGKYGVILPSPFGWIIDARQFNDVIAFLYQRGLSLNEAQKNNEWMYINIVTINEDITSLDELIKKQEMHSKENLNQVKISYKDLPLRKNEQIKLRIIETEKYPSKEYTAFVEFEKFIFYCVLFTPDELCEKNLKKLYYILNSILPFTTNYKSDEDAAIQKILHIVNSTSEAPIKASLYFDLAEIYISMEDDSSATKYFQLTLENDFKHYSAHTGKLFLQVKNNDKNRFKSLKEFIQLDPKNPRVFQDLLEIYLGFENSGYIEELKNIFIELRNEYSANEEVLGNIEYHFAILLMNIKEQDAAKMKLIDCKSHFLKVFEKDHYIFTNIDKLIEEAENYN